MIAEATARRLAALGALVALGALASQLTGGFEHWTHESLRRERAERGELKAPALVLQDQEGRALSPWSGRRGEPRVFIVDFIYTRCATVCLSLGTTFQQLQGRLSERAAEADGVGLLSVTFDPAHDERPDLARYALTHRANPTRWRVARAADEADTRQLLQALGVVVIPDGAGGYVHNAALHLLDHHGRLRALYPLGDVDAAVEHALRLAREDPP